MLTSLALRMPTTYGSLFKLCSWAVSIRTVPKNYQRVCAAYRR